ncbi:MAG: acyl carrier protein [Clostridia bacterium]|nr:acyl carrier protein [Clostridia bacterium]
MLETVANIIADRTGCDPKSVKMESTFVELGIDSLDTVELLMNLEDATGVSIELSQKIETVGELVTLIEENQKGNK